MKKRTLLPAFVPVFLLCLAAAGCDGDQDNDGIPDARDCQPNQDNRLLDDGKTDDKEASNSRCGSGNSDDPDDPTPDAGNPDDPPPDGGVNPPPDAGPTPCDRVTVFEDRDGDSHGDPARTLRVCEGEIPDGYVESDDDCDDLDPTSFPGGHEVCDGADNDCDNDVDDNATREWHLDADGDTHGSGATVEADCDGASFLVDNADDCDDLNPNAFPGATEVPADGIDQDCDAADTCFQDLDGDGFGSSVRVPDEDLTCDAAAVKTAPQSGDLDDQNPNTFPDAPEICDGADNDGNGQTDEGVTVRVCADQDGDGEGDPADCIDVCIQNTPQGYVPEADATDCDDNPANGELFNTRDDDGDGNTTCDPAPDCDDADASANTNDSDGDGNTTCDVVPDCDDGDAALTGNGVSYCADGDGDGFGSNAASARQSFCQVTAPAGFQSVCTDPADNDRFTFPGAPERCDGVDNDGNGQTDEGVTNAAFRDADGDGEGNPTAFIATCLPIPAGFVANNADCDDNAATGADLNHADADQDGNTTCGDLATESAPDCDDANAARNSLDGDGDGSTTCDVIPDCDDANPGRAPGNAELCSTPFDDSCEGGVNEDDATDAPTWFEDGDGDGQGDATSTRRACLQPAGFIPDNRDCNDNAVTAFVGATEVCDGIDNDCDQQVDESVRTQFFADADGDGQGDAGNSTQACTQPQGFVTNALDCDDQNPLINGLDADGDGNSTCGALPDCNDDPANGGALVNALDRDGDGVSTCGGDCDETSADAEDRAPGNPELCSTPFDDSCEGGVNEDDATDAPTWFADADNDGFGNAAVSRRSCLQPVGFVANATDCRDTNDQVNPAAPENCATAFSDDCDAQNNEVDRDVNGVVLTLGTVTGFRDADADGEGNPAVSDAFCVIPAGFVSNFTDCNDGSAALNTRDADADGQSTCAGDCDDGNSSRHRKDSDGDGANLCDVPLDCNDGDALLNQRDTDGDGVSTCGGDCADNDAARTPGKPELCSTPFDDSCNGLANDADADVNGNTVATDALLWHPDNDNDGFGNPAASRRLCLQPAGFVSDATDCRDTNDQVNPAAPENCATAFSDDCDAQNNEVDRDVNGVVLTLGTVTGFRDADADGEGNPAVTQVSCTLPAGFVLNSTDCNDGSATLNTRDTDADGQSTCAGDCNDANATLNRRDVDADGFNTCDAPTDCNDNSAAANPGDADGDGNDTCDALPDCNDLDPARNRLDADGDTQNTCDAPLDCDDTDPARNRRDVDNDGSNTCDAPVDCNDGNATLNQRDVDGDTFTTCSSPVADCSDFNNTRFPGATEVCGNSLDDDCDVAVDETCGPGGNPATDDDGDGFSENQGDCNDANAALNPRDTDGDTFTTCSLPIAECDDSNAALNPNATEVCGNLVDENCNGVRDEGCPPPGTVVVGSPNVDDDGDTFTENQGDCNDGNVVLNPADADGDGESSCEGDCDDTATVINTLATEACEGNLDLDCDGLSASVDPNALCLITLTYSFIGATNSIRVVENGNVTGTLVQPPSGTVQFLEIGSDAAGCTYVNPALTCGQVAFTGNNVNHQLADFPRENWTPRVRTNLGEVIYTNLLFARTVDGVAGDGLICGIDRDLSGDGLQVICN